VRVVEAAVHADVRRVHAPLLARLAQGGLHGSLGAVPGATEQPPRAAVVAPGGAVLQQHLRPVRAGPGQEQPGSAEEAPVPVTEPALDPSVAVSTGVRTSRRWQLPHDT
jgi:hypothetical protein